MQLQINIENKSPIELKLELLEEALTKVKTTSDNVRKGMFARHCELAKMYLTIKEEHERQQLIIDDLKSRLEAKNERQRVQSQRGALYNVAITERSEDGFVGTVKERSRYFDSIDAKCVPVSA